MTACSFDLHRVIGLAAVLGGVLMSGPARAMTVTYECNGHRLLTAELTPREGQIHFEGKDVAVVRVPDSNEARYVNARADVVIVTRQRNMTYTHGGQSLPCFLRSDALSPENLGVRK